MNLSLQNFIIEACDFYLDQGKLIERGIRLSSLIDGISSSFGVYNEQLSEKEYSQFSLNFSIQAFVEGDRNPLMELITIDRKIRLKRDNDPDIEFFITSKTPTFGNKGITYAIVCQDAFSYQFARQSIKITIDTNDEDIWGEYNTGPKTIDELVKKTLELSHLDEWKMDPDINNHIYQFPNNLYFGVEPMKISLEVKEATPYKIITEIANLFNAILLIDYNTKIISFLNKEKASYKGLKMKSNSTLSKFSYSEKGDNLYNIMHVNGGTDAYGNYLSLAPSMPLKISKIITETADIRGTEEEYSILPILNENNYYIHPTFCRIKGNDYIYVKRCINDVYQYIQTTENRYWEECETINDLNSFVNNCYLNLDEEEKDDEDAEDFNLFFKKLSRIPHAGSFMYNFDYWKESGLLTKQRYTNLIKLFNHDMRNVNLKLNAYSSTYNIINYKLQQLIKQEEELISLMAAEDTTNASFISNNNTVSAMNYLSACNYFEDNNLFLKENAYLPIGSVQSGGFIVSYGKDLDGNKMQHSIPDYHSIRHGRIYNVYSAKDGALLQHKIGTWYDNTESFSITNEPKELTTIYIKYTDLLSESDSFITTGLHYNVNSYTGNKIAEYQCQLSNLWNSTYEYYYNVLYGTNWLDKKIQDILSKRQIYVDKKNKIERKLNKIFGSNWRNINMTKLQENINSFAEYTSLIDQLEQICVYVGGEGDRYYEGTSQHYSYKGYYQYYLSALEAFKYTHVPVSGSKRTLSEIVDNLKNQQNTLQKQIYNDYGDVIRETYYNDSSQITDDGLYTASFKQFQIYQKPTKSYSSTYISTEEVENVGENANIGDLIELCHENLNESIDEKSFIISLKNISDIITNIIVEYYDQFNDTIKKENCAFDLLENNKLLIKMSKYLSFDIKTCVIKNIYINGKIYNAYEYNSVEVIEKVYKNNPIKLRITGITKGLRSKIAQLQVEENTLYNTLVDRLIYFLQG